MTAHAGSGAAGSRDDDARLLEQLRAGDEQAFATLVRRYSGSLLHVARMHVPSQAVAEEVVQETWMGVLRGLDRFEERSTLRTWLFRIVLNRAITRGTRERRTVPFASLAADEAGEDDRLEADRFFGPGHRHEGEWATPPRRWDELPEEALRSSELERLVRMAVGELAPMQRLVITMRDLEGWPAEETCNVLGITETNQRVLLHRARAKVRRALEDWFDADA